VGRSLFLYGQESICWERDRETERERERERALDYNRFLPLFKSQQGHYKLRYLIAPVSFAISVVNLVMKAWPFGAFGTAIQGLDI
jgi:hypothetical protein